MYLYVPIVLALDRLSSTSLIRSDSQEKPAMTNSGPPPAPAKGIDQRALAHVKRFVDLWRVDPEFRDQLPGDPVRVVRNHALDIDPDELRPVWDRNFNSVHSPLMQAFVKREQQRIEDRRSIRQRSEPSSSAMVTWRRRQIARCASELGPDREAEIVHAPVVFELSEGCSVGCWFCGLGAQRPVRHADYDQMQGLWREILQVVREVVGEGVKWGFCYWATDPLDNPNYLEFAEDFKNYLGRFPQTTTAIPLRNPARTRDLLERSRERFTYVRFSVLSRGQMRRLMAEFSPEELIDVVLLPLNEGSGMPKSFSGSARTHAAPQGHLLLPPDKSSTIACVSGFLINLVTRTVRLITPCNADERWPLGYWTLAQATFANAEDLAAILPHLIREHMPVELDLECLLRFRRDLRLQGNEDGTHGLTSRWIRHRYPPLTEIPILGELIDRGENTAAEIALQLERRSIPQAITLYALQVMFREGLLREEPDEVNSDLGRSDRTFASAVFA
jgi:radical SAM family RiPP maturation amino acid epimerase